MPPRHGLAVIEDAAQAHGAGPPGARAGSFGLAAGFSFYPSKNLGALGDGGAICTDDAQLADRARALRDLGRGGDGVHREPGFNERLDGLQAAVLRLKLGDLDAANDARRRHATRYRELLPCPNRTLEGRDSSVFHLFPVRCEDRDSLRDHLAAAGIPTGVHYCARPRCPACAFRDRIRRPVPGGVCLGDARRSPCRSSRSCETTSWSGLPRPCWPGPILLVRLPDRTKLSRLTQRMFELRSDLLNRWPAER